MSWEIVKLGDVVKMVTGKTPPTSNKDYFDGEYLWVNPSDFGSKYILESKRTITQKAVDEKKCNLLPKGTILLSCIGDIGKIGILNNQGASNQQITGLITKENVFPDYLYYYLINNKSQLESLANKAVVAILNNERLRDLDVVLPPLHIQKQIAQILDTADALKRKDQQLLKKYDELAQAIFIDMFGDPVKNEKGWEVKKLKDICVKIADGTHFSPPNQVNGIPYITAKHLKKDIVDFYCNPTYINQKDHAEIFSRCNPVKGDVLYIKDGATTGIAAVNEYDFEFSMLSSLALIKPQKKLMNSYYLSCYLNHEVIKQELIRSYMTGAAIKRFTLDKINKFDIMLPPVELQNLFESRWKKLHQSILSIKDSKSSTLFNSLIQKAFNNELVTE